MGQEAVESRLLAIIPVAWEEGRVQGPRKYQKSAQNARRQMENALMAAVNKKPEVVEEWEACESKEEVVVTINSLTLALQPQEQNN